MRVGVIIPTYNRQRLVIEALESVSRQTHAPHRVVVVDDASEDETTARVREWLAEHDRPPGWEVIRREVNGRVSAARNTGMTRTSDCELIAFLDSDDIWHPEMLENVVRSASEHPQAAAYVVDRWFEDWSRGRRSKIQRFDWIEKRPFAQIIRHGCPTPSCVVMRREALESAGGWDEKISFMEDIDLLARLSLRGGFVNIPKPLVRYRLGVGTAYEEAPAMCHSGEDHDLHRVQIVERLAATRAYPGINRQRAFCWFRAGRSAYRRGDWAEAGKYCARALRVAPWHIRAAVIWASSRLRLLASPGQSSI